MSATRASSERREGDQELDRLAPPSALDAGSRFGQLGERFDRRSPFWIGIAGGLGVAVAYVLWSAVSSARGVLLLIALAFVIAIGLEPVVAMLERRRVPRWAGVVILSLAR